VLREAFAGYLPDSILWRQKEQFSDGVGYGWIDGLKAHAEAHVGDAELRCRRGALPDQSAADQGSLLVSACVRAALPGRCLRAHGAGGKSIACSTPAAIAWDAAFANAADPSGRAVTGVHNAQLG
jgi:asparagine synthase (glutamine-hydrolysing)